MLKRISIILAAMACTLSAKAQQPNVGTVSIIPRIGVSIANLPSDNIYVAGNGASLNAKYKAGVMAGVDVDWQFMPNLSAMLGVYYVQQGCKYANNTSKYNGAESDVVHGTGYSDGITQLHYINVPLILNAYLGTGFALKAGVQIGFPVSGKMKYTMQDYTQTKEGIQYGEEKKVSYNLNSTLTKVTFTIPVGISYEYSNVILDARYNIGLTQFQDISDFNSSKNSVFTLSAGYRFSL